MVSTSYAIILSLCAWVVPPSCGAFLTPGDRRSRQRVLRIKTKATLPKSKLLELRGGGDSPTTSTSLQASAADYTGAAQTLFGNVISPAAMLTGGLVPLGFLASPVPDDKPWKKKLRCVYSILAVMSLTSELMAITYATVASNKLTEVAAAPATSVFALIKRDYELPWIATNVHFMFGLLGFVSLIIIRALTIYPSTLNKPAAGFGAAALLAMCSIVNLGVSEGDGRGDALGGNIVSLVFRYGVLIVKHLKIKGGIFAGASAILALISLVLSAGSLMKKEPKESKFSR